MPSRPETRKPPAAPKKRTELWTAEEIRAVLLVGHSIFRFANGKCLCPEHRICESVQSLSVQIIDIGRQLERDLSNSTKG